MTDSALPAHLEVLLTDEPVLDLYAHGPWRLPDALFDRTRARAQQVSLLRPEDLPRVVTEQTEGVMTGQYL